MGRKRGGGTVSVEIVEARTQEQLAMAAELLRAYARAEPDEVCFADFERALYRSLGLREVEPRPGESDEPIALAAELGTRAGEAA
jgi:hypothetical protein